MKKTTIEKRVFYAGTVILLLADRYANIHFAQSEPELKTERLLLLGAVALAVIGYTLHEN